MRLYRSAVTFLGEATGAENLIDAGQLGGFLTLSAPSYVALILVGRDSHDPRPTRPTDDEEKKRIAMFYGSLRNFLSEVPDPSF